MHMLRCAWRARRGHMWRVQRACRGHMERCVGWCAEDTWRGECREDVCFCICFPKMCTIFTSDSNYNNSYILIVAIIITPIH